MGYQKPPIGSKLNYGHPLTRGLIGCWLFNEGSGDKVFDCSKLSNHGTINGVAAQSSISGWDGGPDGPVILFDGSNDYIRMELNKTIMGNKPTIVFGFRPIGVQAGIGMMQVANSLSSATPWILVQGAASSSLRWCIDGGTKITQALNDNRWYNIAAKYDGTTWRAYKNGVADGIYVGALGSNAGSYTWLGNGYSGCFKCQMAYYFVYNRDLSDIEIALLNIFPYCMFDNSFRFEWGVAEAEPPGSNFIPRIIIM